MATDFPLNLRPQLQLPSQTAHSKSSTAPPQKPLPPGAQASNPAGKSTRPQRVAATKARKRLENAYTLCPYEQDPDRDSDAILTRPSAPRPTPVHAEESSDSDVFVDDSESDCPGTSTAARGKKRKRGASPIMEMRKLKVGRSDRELKEGATGFMVKSGSVMRDILLGKESRGSPESWLGQAERVHGGYWGCSVRRAGLSDMGREIGSELTG